MFLSSKMDSKMMGPNRHPLVHGPGGILDRMEMFGYRTQADLARAMLSHPFYSDRTVPYYNLKSMSVTLHNILYGKCSFNRSETLRDVLILGEILSLIPSGTVSNPSEK